MLHHHPISGGVHSHHEYLGAPQNIGSSGCVSRQPAKYSVEIKMRRILCFALILMLPVSLTLKADVAAQNNTPEVIREVTFGECVMVAFLLVTVVMFFYYLFDKYITNEASARKDKVKQESQDTHR